jgi:hypothetical protein
MTPVAPINSDLWRLSNGIHDNFREPVGWPDLTETVAGIYAGLSDDERSRTGTLTCNYGQGAPSICTVQHTVCRRPPAGSTRIGCADTGIRRPSS